MVGDLLTRVDYSIIPQLKIVASFLPGLIGMAILRKSFLAKLSVRPTPQLDAIGDMIEEMLDRHPLGAVFREDIVKEANVSPQRASEIYNSLNSRYENFPPSAGNPLKKASEEYQGKLITVVLDRVEQGMDAKKIMEELHIPGSWINFINDEKKRKQKKLYEKEKINLIARVEELRNQGVGATEISKILKIRMSEAAYYARILRDAGKIPKMRERRNQEQVVALDRGSR